MRKSIFLLVMFPIAAFAQNNRSAVSVNGNDANPCTTVAPCRSFAAALNQTSEGGEIIAVDSAGYGPFTIDRSITISGAPGVHAAITVTSGVGISVLSGNGGRTVIIRNLVLIGNGGDTGISTGALVIVRILACVVRGFATAGISSTGNVVVDHSAVIDNANGIGIVFQNGFPLATGHASVTSSTIQGNASGVVVREKMAAVVKDSLITDNAVGAGAFSATDNSTAEMTLENCTIAHNSTAGVYANAAGASVLARVVLSQNVVAYSPQGVLTGTNASIVSFNNNRFIGNASDGGPFASATFQ